VDADILEKSPVSNSLSQLNDHLFAQINRLSATGLTAEQIDTEVSRAGIDVKTVQQVFATGNSSAAGKAPITLPKAPWETRNDPQ
jgi:hypothetical protein